MNPSTAGVFYICGGTISIPSSSFFFGVMPFAMRIFSNSARSTVSFSINSLAIASSATRCPEMTFVARAFASSIMRETSASICIATYSEHVAMQIDAEVSRIIDEAKARATKVISGHRVALDAIAKELIEKETVERAEFEKILIANGITPKKKEEEGIDIAPIAPTQL